MQLAGVRLRLAVPVHFLNRFLGDGLCNSRLHERGQGVAGLIDVGGDQLELAGHFVLEAGHRRTIERLRLNGSDLGIDLRAGVKVAADLHLGSYLIVGNRLALVSVLFKIEDLKHVLGGVGTKIGIVEIDDLEGRIFHYHLGQVILGRTVGGYRLDDLRRGLQLA